MHRVIAAANRGVKVRILIYDLDTILRDAATPELRDHPFAVIDARPGIEIRLFNHCSTPGNTSSLIGRLFELADDMTRLNQRMHNKLLIADNRAAIIGELRWTSADEVLDIQPARDFLQRIEDQLFMLFPKDLY